MKPEIHKLADKLFIAEERLITALSKLNNFTKECNCLSCNKIDLVHHEEKKSVDTFCLDCGGYKDG